MFDPPARQVWVQNTFISDIREEGEEDPWLIASHPSRLFTDSVISNRRLRDELEENVRDALQTTLPGGKMIPMKTPSYASTSSSLRSSAPPNSLAPMPPMLPAMTPAQTMPTISAAIAESLETLNSLLAQATPLPNGEESFKIPLWQSLDRHPWDSLQLMDPGRARHPQDLEAMAHSSFYDSTMGDASSSSAPAAQVDPQLLRAREVAASGGGLSGNMTVMVRNVPPKYSQQKLLREINAAGFLGKFDFFYLPMQPQSRGNRGFAFINFYAVEDAEAFYSTFNHRQLRNCNQTPPISVLPADLQGFEKNAEHYANNRSSKNRRPMHYGRALFFRNLPPHLRDAGVVVSSFGDCGDAADDRSQLPPAPPLWGKGNSGYVAPKSFDPSSFTSAPAGSELKQSHFYDFCFNASAGAAPGVHAAPAVPAHAAHAAASVSLASQVDMQNAAYGHMRPTPVQHSPPHMSVQAETRFCGYCGQHKPAHHPFCRFCGNPAD